ncbi:uncharacterized protein TRAVEDRAFT_48148 [Trametes versicolor FP-101664 SS1]|uniref:uncharacterized protein n=1 Tax=Trametes versicolor (strain FP-101664) TaxID=717944 RepID=UPI0004621638|nr:uncharacterized protein TRAVEDRAFT_48148 [Trametes versicolor FP-101664 SS1]EIW59021.1 hypothetical protein TRAVEDRAFT_48148 [Trametes versicolor FP-101664 SS1]
MQQPKSEKHIGREIAIPIQCIQTETEKTIEVASAVYVRLLHSASPSSYYDIMTFLSLHSPTAGTDHLDKISLKENATEDCADIPDSVVINLVRRANDELRSKGTVSLSDQEERYYAEVISEILIYDRATGRRGLADPEHAIGIAKRKLLAHKQAGRAGAGHRQDSIIRRSPSLGHGLPPPPGISPSEAKKLIGYTGIDYALDYVFDTVCDWLSVLTAGVKSTLESGGGTQAFEPSSGEDPAAPLIMTQESLGDPSGVHPTLLLP